MESVETSSINVATKARLSDSQIRGNVDVSMRVPVLFFFANALLWLFFGTMFGAMVFFKIKDPEHLSSFFGYPLDFLSYGRIYPAFVHMWIYGWCFQASFGAVLWLLGRMTRAELKAPTLIVVAGLLWNLSVTLGILAILAGDNTGFEWMEFPAWINGPMLLAFAVYACGCIDMLRRRKQGEIYISAWYLFGALFWFPTIYFAANLLLNGYEVSGVMSAVVNAWLKQGIIGLWFVPVGLGLAYFLIPKVIGRPIYSYSVAAFGFWTLAFFSPWNSGAHLIGGPLPAWIITTGITASILMLIPTWVVAFNFHKTLEGNYKAVSYSPTLKFVTFGIVAYVLGQAFLAVTSLRGVSYVSQFTVFSYGYFNLMYYAFFTSIIFGAIYYITPRMTGCEWLSSGVIKWHFLLTVYSVGILVVMWCAGGMIQGAAINDSLTSHLTGFKNVIQSINLFIRVPVPIVLIVFALVTVALMSIGMAKKSLFVPILFLVGFQWLGFILLAVLDFLPWYSISMLVIPVWILAFAQMIFIFHFILMLFRLGRFTGGPTLLETGGH